MDAKELEEAVVTTMQETQVKIGSFFGAESLHLPVAGIDPGEDTGSIRRVLDSLRESCRPRLGDVSCGIMGGARGSFLSREGATYRSCRSLRSSDRWRTRSCREGAQSS